jgi:uracil-DNA glycosylase family 4
MRAELEAIVSELKRLKAEGKENVFIGDDSMENLKSVVTQYKSELTNETVTVGEKIVSAVEDSSIPPPSDLELPPGDKQTRWEWLRNRVLQCPVCNEHVAEGKKVVFGVGNIDADIFFCGEAPGADEEIQGEPFVGRAGQLLTKIIEAMGLQRTDVYIGNIMNWRPETDTSFGNRPPTQEEMNFCLPYLRAQLEVVKPKVIVALGNTAVSGLLGPDPKRRLGSVRGKWFEFEKTPLFVTYHPSYILRSGSIYNKRIIWEDMLLVMEKVGLDVTDKQRQFFRSES